MPTLKDSPKLPSGVIRLIERDILTGKTTKILDCKNVITYEGATVLAHVLAGDIEYRISHIYGEHAAGGAYTPGSTNGLVASKADTIDIMRTLPRTTTDAESPLIFNNYYTSEPPYNKNVVTFSASWSSSAIDGRIIVGAGLIAQVQNAEILFAHAYFPAQIKQTGKELICHWSELFQ